MFQMVLWFLFCGQHFDTETQDLFGIEWAPNGCVLAAWDTCLEVRGKADYFLEELKLVLGHHV